MRETGGKWGSGGVLSKVLEENWGEMGETGGNWVLGGVLSKVLEESGGKCGKLRTKGGWGCT